MTIASLYLKPAFVAKVFASQGIDLTRPTGEIETDARVDHLADVAAGRAGRLHLVEWIATWPHNDEVETEAVYRDVHAQGAGYCIMLGYMAPLFPELEDDALVAVIAVMLLSEHYRQYGYSFSVERFTTNISSICLQSVRQDRVPVTYLARRLKRCSMAAVA